MTDRLCRRCRQPKLVGDPIVLSPRFDEYVHSVCPSMPALDLAARTLLASIKATGRTVPSTSGGRYLTAEERRKWSEARSYQMERAIGEMESVLAQIDGEDLT